MAIHNRSHHNHALMSLNKMRKDNTLKHKTAADGGIIEVKDDNRKWHVVFLTHDITIQRPDGSDYTLHYDNGTLNRLDIARTSLSMLGNVLFKQLTSK